MLKTALNSSVLPDLTDQDLEKLGVLLGDRRKMLRAIAKLDATLPTAIAPAPAPASVQPIAVTTAMPAQEASGERRHVTVMFCDLVIRPEIAATARCRGMARLVGAYLEAASAAVLEMGGKVAKKLGDGLMALFGYPVGQENDAERAVRAALSIQRALAELNRKNAGSGKPVLAARIAINSGPVVVDPAGEIFGDVPNIAARAQALAEPGAVVVTSRVQRQVAGLFVAEERGSHELKGVPEAVTLFRLVRASGGGRRAGQRHLTPLVGRDEEIAMLMRRWERARQGDGQLVLIVGEPGLGKSRPIEEFHAPAARGASHLGRMELLTAFAEHAAVSDHRVGPPAFRWRRRAGGTAACRPGEHADADQARSGGECSVARAAPRHAPTKGTHGNSSAGGVAAKAIRSADRLDDRERKGPAVGAGVRGLAMGRSDDARCAPRPCRAWRAGAFVHRGDGAAGVPAALEHPVASRHHLARAARPPSGAGDGWRPCGPTRAPEGSGRECDRAYRRRATVYRGGDAAFVGARRAGRHPGHSADATTIVDSAARPPGSAREVAQIGAVIGRDFSYNLLHEIAGIGDAPLQAALEKLADADILLVQGLPPASDYRFKHALIQDAAYENLLKSRRQALHRRTGEVLRDQFADTAAAEPELLAHHFTQAGMTEAAIEWWRTAGQRSLARSALLEGAEQLKRALDQIATLPPTLALRREEIKLQVAFANALTLTGDFVNGREQYDRALAIYDLAEHRPLTTRSGRDVGVALLSSRSSCLWLLGCPAASRNDGERAVKTARETGQASTLMYALHASGFNHICCRNYAAANAQIDELIALADQRGAPVWKALGTAMQGLLFVLTGNGSDAVRAITSGITSLRSTGATLYEPRHLWYLAIAYAELGQLNDAWRCIDDAIEKVERSKEKWCEAEVHRIAGEIALKSLAPDSEKAEAYFGRALAVARQQRAKSWELRAAMSMARLWRDQGKRDEARNLLAPVYGWFTEGFDTLDLKEAKALLDELHA